MILQYFKQQMFYYKFDLYYKNFQWFGSKAIKKKHFISPQWLRNVKSKKYANWRIDTFFPIRNTVTLSL